MCIRDSRSTISSRPCSPSQTRHTSLAVPLSTVCLLYTSDAADDLTRVDLGGRRFFQAEDGIRDLVRSRGLGDVYKRQQIDDLLQAMLAVADSPHVTGCPIEHC